MVNIKKAVYDRILEMYQRELLDVEYKIRNNKYRFKELTDEQTTLKRERVRINQLIRDISPKKEGERKCRTKN